MIVVGSGIVAISQLTLEAVAWIEAADVVCYVLADPLTQRWVVDHARSSEDLARLHRPGVPRLHAYRAMSEAIVDHARAGRLVVGVFYGHPGVFTSPSHWAVTAARAAGIPARMLAAVSAEDCLFADLGVDPGDAGAQSLEATDMIMRARVPATDSHVIIWQVGVVGQQSLQQAGRADVLVDYLCRFYPHDHEVVHYQAAQSVVGQSTMTRTPLRELASLPLGVTSTLYVPPLGEREPDLDLVAALGLVPGSTTAPGESAEPDAGGSLNAEPGADADAAGSSDAEPGPDPAWYRPLGDRPNRLGQLLTTLSTDPSLLSAVRADPAPYLKALGLDQIEAWAFLAGNQAWINACVHEGSGPAAAVALGAAATEEEAAGFFVHRDGRLVRRRG